MMVEIPEKVTFFYLKSPHFRVVHMDGALGGITPRGLIHVAAYSERQPIPQSTTQALSPDGRLGDVIKTETKIGIVRELEVDLMLTVQSAIELRDWLTKNIADYEELKKKMEGN